jgi:hypothetical protein
MAGSQLLKVDLSLLESTAGSLALLVHEFDQAGEIVDENHDCIGEPTLLSTMGDFASDWKTHRENLLKSMDSVYKMATQSHQAYISADDQLAGDIEQAMARKATTVHGAS